MRFRIVLLLVTISFCARAQSWEWGQHSPGDINYAGKCIDEDASSNLYIAGTFTGNITLGNISLSSTTQSSYLAKLDAYGTYLWAKKINCNINDIAVDNDIVIAGTFSDTLIFDQTIVNSKGGNDAVLIKFDLSGNLIWLKQGKGTGNEEFKNIHRNSLGNIFITGSSENNMQLDNSVFIPGAFVIVFDSFGNIQNDFYVAANCNGWEISADINNNIYLLCGYSDSLYIGGDFYQADYFGSHFLSKFSPAGNLLWIKNFGSIYGSNYKNLKVTKDGDIYLSRDHRYSDFELLKVSSDGTLKWNKYFGGSVYDNCFDLELDNDENIYMTGGFWYNASYGGISVTGNGSCMFLAKLDSTGAGVWVKSATDSQEYVYGRESSFKNSGHGYLLGSSLGNSQLDGQTVNGPFIAKLTFNTTSVQTISKEEDLISVFPNPNAGTFTVGFSNIEGENKSIMVYDNSGKCVYEQLHLTSNNLITIDLKNLPKGIYSVELIADKKKWIKKMILN